MFKGIESTMRLWPGHDTAALLSAVSGAVSKYALRAAHASNFLEMPAIRQKRNVVAQAASLLCRRLAVGEPLRISNSQHLPCAASNAWALFTPHFLIDSNFLVLHTVHLS